MDTLNMLIMHLASLDRQYWDAYYARQYEKAREIDVLRQSTRELISHQKGMLDL